MGLPWAIWIGDYAPHSCRQVIIYIYLSLICRLICMYKCFSSHFSHIVIMCLYEALRFPLIITYVHFRLHKYAVLSWHAYTWNITVCPYKTVLIKRIPRKYTFMFTLPTWELWPFINVKPVWVVCGNWSLGCKCHQIFAAFESIMVHIYDTFRISHVHARNPLLSNYFAFEKKFDT